MRGVKAPERVDGRTIASHRLRSNLGMMESAR